MKMPTVVIHEEIRKGGAISFARFMELALYCPETGYYEKNQDSVGRTGDFITSVSTGSLFGELLAVQFTRWLGELRIADSGLRIVEAGAHDGALAADILRWLERFRPGLLSEIEYVILEPSLRRQAWQREKLKQFSNVRWISQFSGSTVQRVDGIIFGNELLDPFPTRRLGWDAKVGKWFEWGVTLSGETFAWVRLEEVLQPPAICLQPPELLAVLPDNYTLEISPAAENWWRVAAGILARGKLVAIDYGFTAAEQFSAARLNGTLRAYHRHRATDDLLANPGEQDLTAHVNFPAIQKAGEAAGLKTESFCTQPQFLTRILAGAVKDKSLASLDAKQVRQFQTLTHPEHLGSAFRVLVQSR